MKKLILFLLTWLPVIALGQGVTEFQKPTQPSGPNFNKGWGHFSNIDVQYNLSIPVFTNAGFNNSAPRNGMIGFQTSDTTGRIYWNGTWWKLGGNGGGSSSNFYLNGNYFKNDGSTPLLAVKWADTVKFQNDQTFNQNAHTLFFRNVLSGGGQTLAVFNPGDFNFIADTYNDNKASIWQVDSLFFKIQVQNPGFPYYGFHAFDDINPGGMTIGSSDATLPGPSGGVMWFDFGNARIAPGNGIESWDNVDSVGQTYRENYYAKGSLKPRWIPDWGAVLKEIQERMDSLKTSSPTIYTGSDTLKSDRDVFLKNFRLSFGDTTISSTRVTPFRIYPDGQITINDDSSATVGRQASLAIMGISGSNSYLTAGGLNVLASGVTDVNGFETAYSLSTADYFPGTNDVSVDEDATSGNKTVTLPDESTYAGQIFIFKKADASANTVTILPFSGQMIDGAASIVLTNQYDWVAIQGGGNTIIQKWNIISQRIGGGASLTFSNGLTQTGSNVIWNGNLTQPTTITGNGNNLKFTSVSGNLTTNLQISSTALGFLQTQNTSTGNTAQISTSYDPGNRPYFSLVSSASGTSQVIASKSSLYGTGTGIYVQDSQDSKGMYYAADYSANYTSRSIVDKAYVDAHAGTGTVTSVATGYGLSGGTITTSGTLIADTTSSGALVSKSRLATNLLGYAKSITLNTPNVLYATPINFSNTSSAFSGTLSLNTQTANTVFAGPTTGSAATPTFRALVAADIPALANHSTGYGLSGSAYNGSATQTWTADTTSSTGLVSKSRLATNLTGYAKTANVLTLSTGLTGTSYNGSTNVTTAIDQTFAPTWTGIHTFQDNNIGATPTDEVIVQNATAAALGAQQYSPAINLKGFGWGTTAGTSQAVNWRQYVIPVQGTTASGAWTLDVSLNGGAYSTKLQESSSGTMTVGGGTGSVNAGLYTGNVSSLATTSTDALVTANSTASTSGVPVQYSGRLRLHGTVWNTTPTAANNLVDWGMEVRPVSGTSPTSNLYFMSSLVTSGSPSFTDVANLSSAGALTVNSETIQSTAATQLSVNYDGTHTFTTAVSSAGNVTLNATGSITVTPNTLFSGSVTFGSTNSNLYNPMAAAAQSTAVSQYQYAGSTTDFVRYGGYGNSSTAVTTGNSYAGFFNTGGTVTTPASGTVPNISGAVFTVPVITNGGVTPTNVYTAYFGAASGGTNNYSIYNIGTHAIAGSTSGVISIKPQAAAGTYEFDLPTTAGTANQVLTSQGGAGTAMTWSNTSLTQASADLTAQTSAGNITTFTVGASTATFNVSAYLNVTAISTDVIQVQVTYTDENSNAQTVSFTTLNSISNSTYNPVTIRAKNGTVITAKTNLTVGAGSVTFDAGARISQL